MTTRLYIAVASALAITLCRAGDTPAGSSTTQSATGSNGDFEVSLSAGYESLHVYRGADSSLGGGNLWESIDVEYKNFLHFNLYQGNGLGSKYLELTPTLSVHHDFGPVDISAGVIFYHFPDYHSQDSQEYYIRLSHDFKNGLSTWLHAGYNQDADGYYEELGLRYSYNVTDKFALAPYAAIALSQHYRSTDKSGLDQITVGLTAPYQFNSHISATPGVGIAFPMDTFDGDKELWGSFILTYKF